MIFRRILRSTIFLTAILICCLLAVSQEKPTSQPAPTSSTSLPQRDIAPAHQRPIVGKARIEAGKIVFAGVDGRTWTILNPEALNGLDGKRIKVIAEVHHDNTIRVLHVITYGKHSPNPAAR